MPRKREMTVADLRKALKKVKGTLPVRVWSGGYAPASLEVVGVAYHDSKHGYLLDPDKPRRPPKRGRRWQSFLLAEEGDFTDASDHDENCQCSVCRKEQEDP